MSYEKMNTEFEWNKYIETLPVFYNANNNILFFKGPSCLIKVVYSKDQKISKISIGNAHSVYLVVAKNWLWSSQISDKFFVIHHDTEPAQYIFDSFGNCYEKTYFQNGVIEDDVAGVKRTLRQKIIKL